MTVEVKWVKPKFLYFLLIFFYSGSGIHLFFSLFSLIFHLANIPSKFELVIPSATEVISKRKFGQRNLYIGSESRWTHDMWVISNHQYLVKYVHLTLNHPV